jgi:chromate transporter
MTRPSLRKLAWLVGRDVNRTVGGGLASMELLRRTFTARGWLDPAGYALLVAVSRLTPGTTLLAYCVALGWRLRRWEGAVVALAAASIPSSLVIFVLTATVARVDRYAAVQALLALGILVGAVLVLWTAWQLIRPYLAGPTRLGALIVSAVATGLVLMDVTPVRTLLVAAVVGCLMPLRSPEDPRRGEDAPR